MSFGTILAVIADPEKVSIIDALLISLVAIVIVFSVLLIIVLVGGGASKAINAAEARAHILPKEENKIIDEDEDAAVAALIATIDFYKETGKNARLKSIKRID